MTRASCDPFCVTPLDLPMIRPASLERDETDEALMTRIAQRDTEAMATLVRRHQERVRALARRFTGRWNDADDIAQEAFVRVFRAAGTFRPEAAFTTWLYRIVANLCTDWARRPRLARMEDDAGAADTAPAADEPMQRDERRRVVRAAVAELPQRQRMALILHRFQAQTHAQIAQALACSESAVESLLVRAYAELRRRLAPLMETSAGSEGDMRSKGQSHVHH